MEKQIITLGLGGGCHWCTEAIFSSINGVLNVQQGWLSSEPPSDSFSEGVLLEIDTNIISLKDIISIHIDTHSSDNKHSKRDKYRSAIYVQNEQDRRTVFEIISLINAGRDKEIITQTLILNEFKLQTTENYLDYYYKRPDKPFCKAYINPKLKKLLKLHGKHITKAKIPLIQN